jgi:DNA-binding transcriptional LysR family regulator
MFSIYQLRIFQVVAETESMSRAAERLFLTQPAVSHHIRSLEEDLGVQLFHRGRKGVKLTEAGEVFLEYANRILLLATEAKREAARADGLAKSVVRIGASPNAGTALLPSWILSFHRKCPHVSTSLRTAITPEVVRAIRRREVDVGIVEGEIEDLEDVEVIPLWDEEIVIVVGPSHRWWGKSKIHARELETEVFIVREEGSLTRVWEQRMLEGLGIQQRSVAQFDTPAGIKRGIASGLGIALLPYFSIRNEVAERKLHPVRLHEGKLFRTLKLLWLPENLRTLALRVFLYYLSEEFPHVPIKAVVKYEEWSTCILATKNRGDV